MSVDSDFSLDITACLDPMDQLVIRILDTSTYFLSSYIGISSSIVDKSQPEAGEATEL